jgi:ubiquinone/menaquinone biosynthesis C-methylase UbiE
VIRSSKYFIGYYIDPTEVFLKKSLIEHARAKLLYNELASIYELVIFRNTEQEAFFLNKIINLFKPDAKDILDVGCGVGRHAKLLNEKYGFNVTGIDISKKMIEIAKLQSKNCSFIEMDMRDIKLDKMFDAIICIWSTFNYLFTDEDVKKFFLGVHRALKESGILVIDVKNYTQEEHNQFNLRETESEVYRVRICEYKRIIENVCEGVFFYIITNKKTNESLIALDQELNKVFTFDEMMKKSSPFFQLVKVFGDYCFEAEFDPDKSKRIILVLKKRAG